MKKKWHCEDQLAKMLLMNQSSATKKPDKAASFCFFVDFMFLLCFFPQNSNQEGSNETFDLQSPDLKHLMHVQLKILEYPTPKNILSPQKQNRNICVIP